VQTNEALISSLSEETLPIVIGLNSSKEIWDALAAALSSPSNTRILNIHMQLQNLKQADLSATQYLQKAKLLSDELAAAGRPLCLSDFNIYIFKGLRPEFKDIITTLSAMPEPVTYSELHNLLLNHEFIHGNSVSSLSILSPSLDSSVTPVANLSQKSTNFDRGSNSFGGHGRNNRGRGGCGGRNNYSNNYSKPSFSNGYNE